ncbi:hypothetical protein Ait01nite_015460 [Actinoplanes italicus]|uniref:hypothetical protein n=1 Tax=Actinoplanes italicus TaxID=113567 RepID=UPI0011B20894|nr:hypothetical protein [Actinoplanes italicus]GIE28501.1 hypothetical protein Ait01nite_015460 [Actinoplanes italicus]
MTTTTKALQPPISGPLSDLSRFRRTASVAADMNLTPFLSPFAAADLTPAPRASDRGEQAMHRLRHPFVSPPVAAAAGS